MSRSAPAMGDWTVIYDGDCGVCKTLLALLLRADRHRRLTPLALGTPSADALLADLTPEQRNASWHLIDPAGHRESAGAAAPPLLTLLPGGAVPGQRARPLPEPDRARLPSGRGQPLGDRPLDPVERQAPRHRRRHAPHPAS